MAKNPDLGRGKIRFRFRKPDCVDRIACSPASGCLERDSGMFTKGKTYGNIIRVICMICLACVLAGSTVLAEERTATAYIPVTCGDGWVKETRTYVLGYQDSEHQKITNTTLSLKGGESGKFEIVFDYPGAYHFTVTQKQGTDPETIYDDTVYSVDIYVSQDDSRAMHSEVVAYRFGSKEKTDKLEFRNMLEDQKGSQAGASRDRDGEDGSGRNDGSPDMSTGTPAGETKTGDSSPVREYALLCAAAFLFAVLALSRILKRGGR